MARLNFPKLSLFLLFSFYYRVNCDFVQLSDKYLLEWKIEGEIATFEITAETLGFVGFGISWNGAMKDADIVMGGVKNGVPYLEDRHGIGEELPPLDKQQDYKLLNAYENATHTYLKFSRLLDTCDDNDIPITDDTTRIIWAIGNTDRLNYHGPGNSRGIFTINFVVGIPQKPNLSEYKTWTISSRITMPKADTTYWCTIHKGPELNGVKHHVIGFDVYLPQKLSKRHTHHVDLYRCVPPKGEDPVKFFDTMAQSNGTDCYYTPDFVIRDHCELFEFSWSISGLVKIFPDHVGVPIGKIENEYYMMEVHYDNPDEVAEENFETGLQLYYTDKLRKHDAGFLQFGQKTIYSLMVPPNAENFIIPGHCPSECTRNLPEEGLNVFSILVHSHLAGRKMRLRQFRGRKEMPWLISDEHYDFNYQQNKPIKPEMKIMPKDHITLECTYDSSWKRGPTIGGRSTREEMCQAFALYYPLIEPVNQCASFLPLNRMHEYIGIKNVTLKKGEIDPTITEPEEMAGKKFTEVISAIDWTPEKIEDFQTLMKYGAHDSYCFPLHHYKPIYKTSYPQIDEEYVPVDKCKLLVHGKERDAYMQNIHHSHGQNSSTKIEKLSLYSLLFLSLLLFVTKS